MSRGASRNLTKNEITSRPNLALWCALLSDHILRYCIAFTFRGSGEKSIEKQIIV